MLLLVLDQSSDDLILVGVVRGLDLLLENNKLGDDVLLVLLELLHSLHVENVPALFVLGVEIRIAVLHQVGAGLLAEDHLPL